MYILQGIAVATENKSKAEIQMRIFKERYSESDKVCRCTGDNLKKTFNKN
jgi:hypothetical protein